MERDTRAGLVVCSERVDEALPGWRESIVQTHEPRESGHLPVVELVAGTPRAIQHLVAAAHLSPNPDSESDLDFYELYEGISLEEARDIAILCHRYRAFHLLAGNVPSWLNERSLTPRDWYAEDHPDKYSDQQEYLWISYEFGLDAMFHRVW